MIQYMLTEQEASLIRKKLEDAGYTAHERKMYIRYTKENGNSVFIHHSLNIIRSICGTEGYKILEDILGAPNGKVADSRDDGARASWFFNGYMGKSTTMVYE